MCGDSTIYEDVEKLMIGQKADMVFTDPPYFIFGSSTGMKKSIDDTNMIRPFFRMFGSNIQKFLKLRGHAYVFCDWRTFPIISGEIGRFLEIKNNIVWMKPRLGYRGSMYANRYENIAFFTNESKEIISMYSSYRNQGLPNQRTIYESNIWEEKPVPLKDRKHFAAKPVKLATYAINNSTDENEYVFDPFLGSGTTLMACEQTNRICYAMEIDPYYCQVTVERWEQETSKKALLLEDSSISNLVH